MTEILEGKEIQAIEGSDHVTDPCHDKDGWYCWAIKELIASHRAQAQKIEELETQLAEDIDNSEYSLVKLGKHDLIIGYSDTGYAGSCSCGEEFEELYSSDVPAFMAFRAIWAYHKMKTRINA